MENAFKDVIGYEKVKQELCMIADRIKNPQKYKQLNVEFPRGVLLYGEPGVGKSLMTDCFIKETNVKTFICRKDVANGAFVEVIKKTFEDAKQEPVAVIILDDMDKFANSDQGHQNTDEYVTIQSCIDNCKDHNVFVLATANDIDLLPESLIRAGRFNRVIHMMAPSGAEAADIVRHYLKDKELDQIDAEEVANLLEGSSCAQLEMIINDAGLYAGYDNRSVLTMDDIVRAFSVIRFRNLCEERGEEESAIIDDDEARRIAYHEAGHVLVSEVLDKGSVNYVYYDNCGVRCGITGYSLESANRSGYLFSAQEVIICRNLAGKAATEIIFGTPDIGCSGDVGSATDLLEDILGKNCIFGFDHFHDYMVGDFDRQRSRSIVSYELARYLAIDRRIITQNRDFLDALANTLLEKHYLLRSDIKRIEDGFRLVKGDINDFFG